MPSFSCILNEENFSFQFFTDLTELVMAQLMYLESKNPDKPITFYIDSSGSEDEHGETVSLLWIFTDVSSLCLYSQ